jgi:hypothetical protein
MSNLINCNTCKGKVSSNAKVCPHCGEPDFDYSKIKAKQEEINYFRFLYSPECKATRVDILVDRKDPGKFLVQDTLTKKIGFIHKRSLNNNLQADDIWNAKIVEEKGKFFVCHLIDKYKLIELKVMILTDKKDPHKFVVRALTIRGENNERFNEKIGFIRKNFTNNVIQHGDICIVKVVDFKDVENKISFFICDLFHNQNEVQRQYDKKREEERLAYKARKEYLKNSTDPKDQEEYKILLARETPEYEYQYRFND